MQPASLAILNGFVWAPGRSPATAIAVTGDRISAIGSDEQIAQLCGSGAQVIDAAGSTILPAFNDAHVHFLMGSRALSELDLFGAETQVEVERRVTEHAANRRGPWVLGRGWFYSAFPGGMPSVGLLDRLVPDRPAYLESFDAHTAWANSRALAIAGIGTSEILKEAAMLKVSRQFPARSTTDDLDSLRSGMRVAAAHGIGSMQEAGEGLEQVKLWEALRATGELTLRVRLAFDMTPGLDTQQWRSRLEVYREATPRDNWISGGILKAFADGVIESRTAAMLEPYEGSGGLGEPLWGEGELTEAVQAADVQGWQVQTHAIGDAAIRQALDAYAGGTKGRRHRVEHVEAPSPDDFGRFADLGVVASMQPQHAAPNRNLIEVWAANLGTRRASNGWPWASIKQRGGRLAFGTDWPGRPARCRGRPARRRQPPDRRRRTGRRLAPRAAAGAGRRARRLDRGQRLCRAF